MIPQGSILGSNPNANIGQQPSKTYKLDLVSGRLLGNVEGLEAMKQTVFQILQTERFEHLIFTGGYGSELAEISGKSESFVRTELGRRIRMALLQDDRIKDVQDMVITATGDEALAVFTVVTQLGNFEATKVVF